MLHFVYLQKINRNLSLIMFMINIRTEISLSRCCVYLLIDTLLKSKETFHMFAMLLLYILHIHVLHENCIF